MRKNPPIVATPTAGTVAFVAPARLLSGIITALLTLAIFAPVAQARDLPGPDAREIRGQTHKSGHSAHFDIVAKSVQFPQDASQLPNLQAQSKVRNSEMDGSLFYDLLLANIYSLRGDFPQSNALIFRAAQKSADEALLRRAVEFAILSNATESARDITSTWLRKKTNSAAAIEMAIMLLDKDFRSFTDDIDGYFSKNPKSELRSEYASRLASIGDTERAYAEAKATIKNRPGDTQIWYTLGALQSQAKDWALAKKSFERYIELENKDSKEKIGKAEIHQARIALANMALAENAHFSKDRVAMLSYIQRALNANRTLPNQATVLTRALALYAENKMVDKGRALLANWPQKTDAEKAEFEELRLNFYRNLEDWETVYQLVQEKMRATPGAKTDPNLLYELGLAAEKLGRSAEMEKLLREAISIDPKHYQSLNALGYALADRNENLPYALELIQRALQEKPQSPYIIDSLGWVEYRRGNLDKAEQHLQQAYAIDPDPEIAAHLGEVLWANNKKEEAKRIWRAGLKSKPEHKAVQDTLKRLGVDMKN